jgi:hypothetical protein
MILRLPDPLTQAVRCWCCWCLVQCEGMFYAHTAASVACTFRYDVSKLMCYLQCEVHQVWQVAPSPQHTMVGVCFALFAGSLTVCWHTRGPAGAAAIVACGRCVACACGVLVRVHG